MLRGLPPLPFVSRGRYEDAIARYHERSAEYRALLDKYHALKAGGASEPVPPPMVTPLPKRPADRVTEVIADVAGSNAALRRALGAYARRARAEEKSEDEIIRTLLHWPSDDDGVAD